MKIYPTYSPKTIRLSWLFAYFSTCSIVPSFQVFSVVYQRQHIWRMLKSEQKRGLTLSGLVCTLGWFSNWIVYPFSLPCLRTLHKQVPFLYKYLSFLYCYQNWFWHFAKPFIGKFESCSGIVLNLCTIVMIYRKQTIVVGNVSLLTKSTHR